MSRVVNANLELIKLFHLINQKYFNNELPNEVEITVQSKGRINAYGWFVTEKIWWNKERGYYEINMCAEHLNRDFDRIVGTLIHEMVHFKNRLDDIKDVSSASQYHNKKFKISAEKVGLMVEKVPKTGYSKTTINEDIKRWAETINIDKKTFKIARTSLYGKNDTDEKGSKTKMKKWSCGCTNIRCAVELQATCLSCNNKFLLCD